jgi:hypothetical protein
MSQENVEIVRAWYDAFNREDWDAMLKDAAPGFEVDSRGQSVFRPASSDLISFGDSRRNSARTGNPLGWSPTNSSKPVIS